MSIALNILIAFSTSVGKDTNFTVAKINTESLSNVFHLVVLTWGVEGLTSLKEGICCRYLYIYL